MTEKPNDDVVALLSPGWYSRKHCLIVGIHDIGEIGARLMAAARRSPKPTANRRIGNIIPMASAQLMAQHSWSRRNRWWRYGVFIEGNKRPGIVEVAQFRPSIRHQAARKSISYSEHQSIDRYRRDRLTKRSNRPSSAAIDRYRASSGDPISAASAR